MNEGFKIIFYYILMTMPYFTIAYIPFDSKLRFSKPQSCLMFVSLTLFACCSVALLYLSGIKYRYIEFILGALYILMYFVLVKQNIFKLIFFCVFIADTIIVIRGIALFLSYNIFGFDESMYIASGFIHIAAFAVVFPLMYIPIRKDIDIIFETEGLKMWSFLWLLPFIITIIVFIYTNDISPTGVQKWQFASSRLLFGVSTLLVYKVLLQSLEQIREQTLLKERAEKASHIIQIYTERYDLLKSQIEETKKARHNLRQHMNFISACLEKNDIKTASEYLNKYIKSMPNGIKGGYSANYAVDTIVGWYAEQAELRNIKFDADIKIPSKINISEPELCTALGNLIENAVNACEQITDASAFIKIRGAAPADGTVIFTVDNSCLDNSYSHEKALNKGLGLQSVYDIARKYNGIAEFECKNNVFYASVMLNRNPSGI